ncbi:hypothetical protein G3545_06200 [Starkeya sp. ORNL1]|uniref:hypothetical protein n=1 Tax=Starkeya sp. ORNL1 TaxID=2709380 RepID=UPI001462CDD6|nr:hypothetical protein [Starkeya sp. ORNL1]QJP13277.1 hypothetical protein G3545_06200 [Starkeya sp. ORNL1]
MHEIYRIVGQEGAWHVVQEAGLGMAYTTKEAAFEAAVSAATNAIEAGHDVTIRVPTTRTGESQVGGQSD